MSNAFETGELIDLIVKRAPELREAGVLSMTAGGVSLVLAPADPPEADDDDDTDERDQHPDPLLDPATYAGGVVPRYEDDDDAPPSG